MRNVADCVSPRALVRWADLTVPLTALVSSVQRSLQQLPVWRRAKQYLARTWTALEDPSIRIALWRLNDLHALALTFAVAGLDAVPVWLNDRWNAREVQEVLLDALPHLVIVGSASDFAEISEAISHLSVACICPVTDFLADPQKFLPDIANDASSTVPGAHWHVLECFDRFAAIYNEEEQFGRRKTDEHQGSRTSAATPYAIYYTSGTSGKAKGAVISHRAMLVQAHAKITHVGYNANTKYLHLAPLFHIGGASSAAAVALAGGCHVILPSQHNSAEWLRAIKAFFVNTLVVVPAMLQMMMDTASSMNQERHVSEDVVRHTDQKNNIQLSCVETVLCGGGTPSLGLLKAVVKNLFPNARIICAYGMTETASSITFLDYSRHGESASKHLCVGVPPSHVEIEVRHMNEIATARDGSVIGEIVTRGPHVMNEYFRRPRESRTAIDCHGWLATGDLGYLDRSGNLFLTGRLKDMIKTGGENVFAAEVEAALAQYPGLQSTAVVGIPHRVLGEAVAAAIIASRDWKGEALLRAWCRERLSPFKIPRWIVPMKCFPSNSLGKIMKDELRVEIMQRLHIRAKL